MESNNELALATKNEVAIASASAMAIAEIRTAMQLAKMYPRDNNQARINILDTCRRPGFAPHLCYGKPIGGRIIPGISIRGAEVAANYWGNIKSMSGIVYDDEKKRIVNIVSMDLQTNTSYSSQVVVDKIIERKYLKKGQIKLYERENSEGKTVYGVTPTTDEFEVKVAAQISKQIRNNILRLIPEDIKEEMVIAANKTMADKAAEDPFGEVKKIVDCFATLRVMPIDLHAFLGHDVGKCSPAQVAELRVMYKSIKDGEAVWSDYLPEVPLAPEKQDNNQTPLERAKDDLTQKVNNHKQEKIQQGLKEMEEKEKTKDRASASTGVESPKKAIEAFAKVKVDQESLVEETRETPEQFRQRLKTNYDSLNKENRLKAIAEFTGLEGQTKISVAKISETNLPEFAQIVLNYLEIQAKNPVPEEEKTLSAEHIENIRDKAKYAWLAIADTNIKEELKTHLNVDLAREGLQPLSHIIIARMEVPELLILHQVFKEQGVYGKG